MNAITLKSAKELAELDKEEEKYSRESKLVLFQGKKYKIPVKCKKGVEEEKETPTYVATPTYDPSIPYP